MYHAGRDMNVRAIRGAVQVERDHPGLLRTGLARLDPISAEHAVLAPTEHGRTDVR